MSSGLPPFTSPLQPTAGAASNSANGVMNGTTEVTLVPATSEDSYRVVYCITFYNADIAGVGWTLSIKPSTGSKRSIYRSSVLANTADTTIPSLFPAIVLKGGESLVAVLDSAVTSNEPHWSAHWGEPA